MEGIKFERLKPLTRDIGDLVADDDVAISWPVCVRNNHTWRTSVKQAPTASTSNVNQPLLHRHHVACILRFFIPGGLRTSNNNEISSVLLLRNITFAISPELRQQTSHSVRKYQNWHLRSDKDVVPVDCHCRSIHQRLHVGLLRNSRIRAYSRGRCMG